MIVRNESAILRRCLLSVRPYLACYVICDTGSEDDTISIIRDVFQNLPGEIHSTTFRDFAQARNESLRKAQNSGLEFDYILLIDADMELVVEDPEWMGTLSDTSYSLTQRAGTLAYQNVRLLARNSEATYVGATHEYLNLPHRSSYLKGVHMLDHACGSSRAVKTKRDLHLLRASVAQDPQDARSLFYLAQTLREAGDYQEAITIYQQRIHLGGWEEEVWFSYFMIAQCYHGLENYPYFIAACLEAYNFRPSRSEPLHALAEHYRFVGLHDSCLMLCEIGLSLPLPNDVLFVREDIYHTGFRSEYSISGFYSAVPERKARARNFCKDLATERMASTSARTLARSNWQHYALNADKLFGLALFTRLEHPVPPGRYPCNPSLAIHEGQIWCVLRIVNFVQDDQGEFLTLDGDVIRSENLLLRLDHDLKPTTSIPIVDSSPNRIENPGIVGLEDIRFHFDGEKFRGYANAADRSSDWRRTMVVFDFQEDGIVRNLSIQEFGSDSHQKNWVPFLDEGQLGFIYWTDPTTVLRWDEKSRQVVPWHHHPCPAALENLRGSSGAIPFDNGWLYIAHEVTWQGVQRTYLHRFVKLDSDFRVVAVTESFYFYQRGIEFCCGLIAGPQKDQLLVSFGVWDREAWLVVLEADSVRAKLQSVRS